MEQIIVAQAFTFGPDSPSSYNVKRWIDSPGWTISGLPVGISMRVHASCREARFPLGDCLPKVESFFGMPGIGLFGVDIQEEINGQVVGSLCAAPPDVAATAAVIRVFTEPKNPSHGQYPGRVDAPCGMLAHGSSYGNDDALVLLRLGSTLDCVTIHGCMYTLSLEMREEFMYLKVSYQGYSIAA